MYLSKKTVSNFPSFRHKNDMGLANPETFVHIILHQIKLSEGGLLI